MTPAEQAANAAANKSSWNNSLAFRGGVEGTVARINSGTALWSKVGENVNQANQRGTGLSAWMNNQQGVSTNIQSQSQTQFGYNPYPYEDTSGDSLWGKHGKLNTGINFLEAGSAVIGTYLGFKQLAESKRQAKFNESVARTNVYNQANVTNEAIYSKYNGKDERDIAAGGEGGAWDMASLNFGASNTLLDEGGGGAPNVALPQVNKTPVNNNKLNFSMGA